MLIDLLKEDEEIIEEKKEFRAPSLPPPLPKWNGRLVQVSTFCEDDILPGLQLCLHCGSKRDERYDSTGLLSDR
jgi:hypothetical protein